MEESENFIKIPNKYMVGNPIKTEEMFFGRNNDFAIIRDWIYDGYKVILLKGGRRSGKTSILYQINNGRLSDTTETVFCDFYNICPQLEKDEDLPYHIAITILRSEIFSDLKEEFQKNSGSMNAALGKLIRICLRKIAPKKLILLCDEYEALENNFSIGNLSSNSLTWFDDIKSLDVCFVMTGSKDFNHSKYLSPKFSPVSIMLEVNTLTKPDAMNLILKPIEGYLDYREDTAEKIYRLTGGHPFYTQYVCQSLVSHINATLKRNFVKPDDLHDVIHFIIRNPAGHIQETWRTFPFNVKHTIAALARTLNSPEERTRIKAVLQTARKYRFLLVDQDCYEAVSWLKKETSLMDWESDEIRFNIDIFRYWIERYFQTGEDIEPEDLPKKLIEKPTNQNGKKQISAAIVVGIFCISMFLVFRTLDFQYLPSDDDNLIFQIGDCIRIKKSVTPCAGWEKGIKGAVGKITHRHEEYLIVDFSFKNQIIKDYVACPEDLERVPCK